jgi:serine phosphatase RsbU (regulator of sigma subunit)
MTLQPGCVVVLCSDGILEAENRVGEEFGSEGLTQSLAGGAKTADVLLESVLKYTEGAAFADDATLVMIRRAAA